MKHKIRALIVDDSAVVRQTLAEILSADPGIEVMAVASDPFVAADKIAQEIPDVITLDVEMPRMDGITFLQKIMSQHPIPVVICSSLTGSGSETALKALEYGAVDIIEKPRLGTKLFLKESGVRICDAVKAAAQATAQEDFHGNAHGRAETECGCHYFQAHIPRHDPDDGTGCGSGRIHRRYGGASNLS